MEEINEKYTDYGPDYNRESMYETVREQLMDGKPVKIFGQSFADLVSVINEDANCELREKRYLDLKVEEMRRKGFWNGLDTLYASMSDEKNNVFHELKRRVDKAKILRYKTVNNEISALESRFFTSIDQIKPYTTEQAQTYHDYLVKLEDYFYKKTYSDICDIESYSQYLHAKQNREIFVEGNESYM